MVRDSQSRMITRISTLVAVLLVMLIPLGHVTPLAFALQEQRQQLFGGFSHAIASSSFGSDSNRQGSLTGFSPSALSFSGIGTHDTNDGGSWYKHDQFNHKYNNYRGDNNNNNNNNQHKKWHHHGSSSSGDLVVNNQNADCSSTSNANGGAGIGGSGGNTGGGNGGSSNGGSGSGASGGTSNGGSGSTTGSGGSGGTSNGGNGGSSPGAPGVGGSSDAGSETSCSNTSTFNLSRA